ncbi:Golgi to ER traffic- protein [Puccinia graminis f. sp. tritici]|uniref:Golgi to ER traffic-protein n=1 Tax=Puccinia graminis f. sp. tritici TaxID=56615 RepID=A0A5B0S9A9_PUCGR|nr:Golgi to ER traffic- protein [Puccinia graminis f. sp. tritici]
MIFTPESTPVRNPPLAGQVPGTPAAEGSPHWAPPRSYHTQAEPIKSSIVPLGTQPATPAPEDRPAQSANYNQAIEDVRLMIDSMAGRVRYMHRTHQPYAGRAPHLDVYHQNYVDALQVFVEEARRKLVEAEASKRTHISELIDVPATFRTPLAPGDVSNSAAEKLNTTPNYQANAKFQLRDPLLPVAITREQKPIHRLPIDIDQVWKILKKAVAPNPNTFWPLDIRRMEALNTHKVITSPIDRFSEVDDTEPPTKSQGGRGVEPSRTQRDAATPPRSGVIQHLIEDSDSDEEDPGAHPHRNNSINIHPTLPDGTNHTTLNVSRNITHKTAETTSPQQPLDVSDMECSEDEADAPGSQQAPDSDQDPKDLVPDRSEKALGQRLSTSPSLQCASQRPPSSDGAPKVVTTDTNVRNHRSAASLASTPVQGKTPGVPTTPSSVEQSVHRPGAIDAEGPKEVSNNTRLTSSKPLTPGHGATGEERPEDVPDATGLTCSDPHSTGAEAASLDSNLAQSSRVATSSSAAPDNQRSSEQDPHSTGEEAASLDSNLAQSSRVATSGSAAPDNRRSSEQDPHPTGEEPASLDSNLAQSSRVATSGSAAPDNQRSSEQDPHATGEEAASLDSNLAQSSTVATSGSEAPDNQRSSEQPAPSQVPPPDKSTSQRSETALLPSCQRPASQPTPSPDRPPKDPTTLPTNQRLVPELPKQISGTASDAVNHNTASKVLPGSTAGRSTTPLSDPIEETDEDPPAYQEQETPEGRPPREAALKSKKRTAEVSVGPSKSKPRKRAKSPTEAEASPDCTFEMLQHPINLTSLILPKSLNRGAEFAEVQKKIKKPGNDAAFFMLPMLREIIAANRTNRRVSATYETASLTLPEDPNLPSVLATSSEYWLEYAPDMHKASFQVIIDSCPRLFQLPWPHPFFNNKHVRLDVLTMGIDEILEDRRAGGWSALHSMMCRSTEKTHHHKWDFKKTLSAGSLRVHQLVMDSAKLLKPDGGELPQANRKDTIQEIESQGLGRVGEWLSDQVSVFDATDNDERSHRAHSEGLDFLLRRAWEMLHGASILHEAADTWKRKQKKEFDLRRIVPKRKRQKETDLRKNASKTSTCNTKKAKDDLHIKKLKSCSSLALFLNFGVAGWFHCHQNHRKYNLQDLASLMALCEEMALNKITINSPLIKIDGSTRKETKEPIHRAWERLNDYLLDLMLDTELGSVDVDWFQSAGLWSIRLRPEALAPLVIKDLFSEISNPGDTLSSTGGFAPTPEFNRPYLKEWQSRMAKLFLTVAQQNNLNLKRMKRLHVMEQDPYSETNTDNETNDDSDVDMADTCSDPGEDEEEEEDGEDEDEEDEEGEDEEGGS